MSTASSGNGPRSNGFLAQEDGATAIEYGLIAALVAIVIVISLSALGGAVFNMWTKIETAVTGA